MQRFLRQTLCILAVLGLSASLFPMNDSYARGGGGNRGGGSRGASSRGASSRSGGGASPRVNRSVSTQNQGNFNSRPQSSVDRSQGQQNRQGQRTERQGERQTTQQDRQGQYTERQGERQTTQQNRQSQRTEQTDIRQEGRTDRQGERQEQTTDRQDNRQDFVDDNYNGDHWYGGGWNGNGYYVPPGWGWAGLATGLVIGAAVATPPPYYDTVYVGSSSYMYSDGVYMQPSGDSYTIVAPPAGAVVTYLPDGCTTTQMNDIPIYSCSGIYYQPFFQNGSTVYQVVQF